MDFLITKKITVMDHQPLDESVTASVKGVWIIIPSGRVIVRVKVEQCLSR